MKISDRTNFTGTQRRKLSLGILLLLFLGSIIAGTIIVCTTDNLQKISYSLYTQNLLKTSMEKTIAEIYFSAFIPLTVILIIQFVSGFFAFGQSITVMGIIYRGISTGIAASLFYLTLGLKGFFAILVMLFPFGAFSAVILILGARESIKFSNMFMNFIFKKHNENNSHPEIKLYIVKFLVLMLFVIFLAAADSIITYFFTGILLKP